MKKLQRDESTVEGKEIWGKVERAAGRHEDELYYRGVVTALGIVYEAKDANTALEIVDRCGPRNVLAAAKAVDSPWLPELEETIKSLSASKKKAKA